MPAAVEARCARVADASLPAAGGEVGQAGALSGRTRGRPGRRSCSTSTWSVCSWVTRTASRADQGARLAPGAWVDARACVPSVLEGDAGVAPAGQAHGARLADGRGSASVPSASSRCSQEPRNGASQASTSAAGSAETAYSRRRPSARTVANPLSRSTEVHRHRRLADPELLGDHLDHLAEAARRRRAARGCGGAPGRRARRRRASARRRSRGVGRDAPLRPRRGHRRRRRRRPRPRPRPCPRRTNTGSGRAAQLGPARASASARCAPRPTAPAPSRCRRRRGRTRPRVVVGGAVCTSWSRVPPRSARSVTSTQVRVAVLPVTRAVAARSHARTSPPALPSSWKRPPRRRSPESGSEPAGDAVGVGEGGPDLVGGRRGAGRR